MDGGFICTASNILVQYAIHFLASIWSRIDLKRFICTGVTVLNVKNLRQKTVSH